MIQAINSYYNPNKVVILHNGNDENLSGLIPHIIGKSSVDGMTTAYVCRSYACLAPVFTKEDLIKILEG